MLVDVQVATPQPKKSVSSVQIGQPRARGCENRPVLRIACAKSLPRFGFEIAIDIQADESC
jgi:hypothetical protein